MSRVRRVRPAMSLNGGGASSSSSTSTTVERVEERSQKSSFSLESLKMKNDKPSMAITVSPFASSLSCSSSRIRHRAVTLLKSIFLLLILSAILGIFFKLGSLPQALLIRSFTRKFSQMSFQRFMNRRRAANNNSLRGLPNPGEYAPVVGLLDPSRVVPLVKVQPSPHSEYHIFFLGRGPRHLPTVILSNILIGLFEPASTTHVANLQWSSVGDQYLTRYQNEFVEHNTTSVSLVGADEPYNDDDEELASLQRNFRTSFKYLFFVAWKDDKSVLCKNPPEDNSILCLDEKHIKYTSKQDLQRLSAKVVHKLKTDILLFSQLNFDGPALIKRLEAMDDMIQQMKELPDTTEETKYGTFGGTPMAKLVKKKKLRR